MTKVTLNCFPFMQIWSHKNQLQYSQQKTSKYYRLIWKMEACLRGFPLTKSLFTMIIITSHTFKNVRALSWCQACWAQFLVSFDFLITYHPRVQHGKVDTLSRQSYLALWQGEPTIDHKKLFILRLDRLWPLAANAFKAPIESRLLNLIWTNTIYDKISPIKHIHLVMKNFSRLTWTGIGAEVNYCLRLSKASTTLGLHVTNLFFSKSFARGIMIFK